jgi:hypothetical protein
MAVALCSGVDLFQPVGRHPVSVMTTLNSRFILSTYSAGKKEFVGLITNSRYSSLNPSLFLLTKYFTPRLALGLFSVVN